MTVDDRVLDAISKQPYQTELQLSQSIFGKEGYQQKVNPSCRRLLKKHLIKRIGKGGVGEPFTYDLL